MATIAKITGGCQCGSVRFEGDGKWRTATACHCGQCRKQTGSFYMATGTANEDFKFLKDDGLTWYKASEHAERGFCKHCGTVLFWRSVDEDWVSTAHISVMLGALDDTKGIKIEKHIFVGDKGDYYEIGDGLPQLEAV